MMKNKKTKIIFFVLAGALMALILWTAWGNTALELNIYTITSDRLPEAFDGFRIAQISDLHNAELGEGNKKLLALLRETEPDIIAVTGDLIDSSKTDVETALEFAEAAVEIAPCYYVTGNHEAWTPEYKKLKEGLVQAGVTVLENKQVELEREGEHITLLGVDDPAFQSNYMTPDSAVITAELEKLVTKMDEYTILLSHRPELFETYVSKNIDLVLSGHAHGGQFRLPLVGGLAAPDQGLFPKYDAGIYTEGNTNMVVSRGIGNSIIPFRFNNRPEVILIELQKETAVP